MLEARGRMVLEVWDTGGIGGICCGRLLMAPERLGEGVRRVRSVIDPELPGRFPSACDELCKDPVALPIELVEFFLAIRFVCTSPT
jgi:hypothetical protein